MMYCNTSYVHSMQISLEGQQRDSQVGGDKTSLEYMKFLMPQQECIVDISCQKALSEVKL